MAYMIIRGSQGYVSMVDKGRVNGSVQTKKYICGLGKMSYEDFKTFQAWAHSLKPQEYRKAQVLSCPIAIAEKERLTKLDIKPQTSPKKPVKRTKGGKTIKKAKKLKSVHDMPVPSLAGYKGIDRYKTHTQIMRERETERKEKEKLEQLYKRKYVDITPKQRKTFIKELEQKRTEQINIRDEWEIKSLGGGLYFGKHERSRKARAEREIKRIDTHLKELKRGE